MIGTTTINPVNAAGIRLTGLLCAILLSASLLPSRAQSLRYYESKDAAALAEDLLNACDGDTFVLTSSGGRYALDSWLNIRAKVSIIAAEDLIERPVLTNYKESNTVQIMRLFADGCSIYARGIEFDSESRGAGNYPVKYAIRTNPDIGSYSLVLEDCYFHGDYMANDGSSGSILRMYNGTHADSIIIRDCIFEGDEGIVLNSSGGDFSWDKFEISNSTFLDIPGDHAIQIVQKGDFKTLPFRIDHCTFANVGGADKDVMVIDSLFSARITNSIFAHTAADASFHIFGDLSRQAVADYISVFECPLPLADKGGTLGSNTWNLDPMFADMASGDLSLGNDALLSLGNDGLPLGDRRWADIWGPVVEEDLEVLSATTLLLSFGEWVDTTTAEAAANYELSGSAGLTGPVLKAELHNFRSVVLTLKNFASRVGHEIVVTVTGVEDLKGNVADPMQNTASCIIAELNPKVSANEQFLSNGTGQVALAQSNLDNGKLWVILEGEAAGTLAELEAAVAAGKGASAGVSAANKDTEIGVYGITPGRYFAYASNEEGLVSERGSHAITITDGIPPEVSLDIQSVYNGEGDVVRVQSSEPGKIYIVRDGEKQETEDDFQAAILVSRGSSAPVSEAGTDQEISSTGCVPGIYFAYAADLAGNISVRGDMPVNIMESALSTINQDALQARVYASGQSIVIESSETEADQVIICDLSGRILFNRQLTSGYSSFRMEKRGVYLVKLLAAEQEIMTYKIPLFF